MNDNGMLLGVVLWMDQPGAAGRVLALDPQVTSKLLEGSYATIDGACRRGVLRHNNKLAWQYEQWLVPVNQTVQHWYLIAVDVPQRRMTVYDSLGHKEDSKDEADKARAMHHNAAVNQIAAYFQYSAESIAKYGAKNSAKVRGQGHGW
jgi:hypothetical protein